MCVGVAHAAPLNFATAENASLLSPTTTLTIATGSAADALKATTSSVIATLSSSTGGSFTLLSPSYDLAVATSSGGGTVNISCSSGIESAVISQTSGSTAYTITTAGTTCASSAPPVISNIGTSGITTSGATISWTTNVLATTTIEYGADTSFGSTANDGNLTTGDSVTLSGLSPNTTYHFAIIAYANSTSTTSGDNTITTSAASSGGGGGSSGGGGGGGGGGYYFPPTTSNGASTTTTAGMTVAQMESLLASLEAQLNTLEAEAGGGASFTFTRNLSLGMSGADVHQLQLFLVARDAGPNAKKLAAHGTTQHFASLTKPAH